MLAVEFLDPGVRSPGNPVALHLLDGAPHVVLQARIIRPLIGLLQAVQLVYGNEARVARGRANAGDCGRLAQILGDDVDEGNGVVDYARRDRSS